LHHRKWRHWKASDRKWRRACDRKWRHRKWRHFPALFPYLTGLDINVCPIPVKTDVGQVDLVLRLSNGTSEKIRDSQTCRYDGQIYFHWYKILGLLYKRALFDLQFVHNLFWLRLKWNARSKIFYWYHLSFIHALMKFKDIDKIKVAISETL
jgi:hypothetical protein